MNEPKFTKGPYRLDGSDRNDHCLLGIYIAQEKTGGRIGQTFANCLVQTDEECRANAHLWASAPELYQELLDRYTQTRCGCGHSACGRCGDDRDTEAVLARARGEDVE